MPGSDTLLPLLVGDYLRNEALAYSARPFLRGHKRRDHFVPGATVRLRNLLRCDTRHAGQFVDVVFERRYCLRLCVRRDAVVPCVRDRRAHGAGFLLRALSLCSGVARVLGAATSASRSREVTEKKLGRRRVFSMLSARDLASTVLSCLVDP